MITLYQGSRIRITHICMMHAFSWSEDICIICALGRGSEIQKPLSRNHFKKGVQVSFEVHCNGGHLSCSILDPSDIFSASPFKASLLAASWRTISSLRMIIIVIFHTTVTIIQKWTRCME